MNHPYHLLHGDEEALAIQLQAMMYEIFQGNCHLHL